MLHKIRAPADMVVCHHMPAHELEAGDIVSARLLRDNQYMARRHNWPPNKFVTLPAGALCTISGTLRFPSKAPFYGILNVEDPDLRPGPTIRLSRLFESPGAAIFHATTRLHLNKNKFLVIHLSKP